MQHQKCKRELKHLKSHCFPVYIFEWNKLNDLTKQSESIKKIKNISMKDIKPNEQSLFSIHNPQVVNSKLFSRRRLAFIHVTPT